MITIEAYTGPREKGDMNYSAMSCSICGNDLLRHKCGVLKIDGRNPVDDQFFVCPKCRLDLKDNLQVKIDALYFKYRGLRRRANEVQIIHERLVKDASITIVEIDAKGKKRGKSK